mgnify:CR=1 FL=1
MEINTLSKSILNLLIKSVFISIFLVSLPSLGQTEDLTSQKRIKFSGSADVYFRQNITGPNGSDAIAPNTSFANQNGFAIGMANAIISYEGEKVGAVVDLVFGPRGTDAVFGSLQWDLDNDGNPDLGNSSQILNQIYVFWNVTEKMTLTFGNFNTFLGYEVISPVGNFNYSTSYMFSYGPFSHSGLKLDYALTDNWSAMLAIMNGNDFTNFNPTNNYTLGVQIAYKDTYLNFIYGPQFQVDLTTGFDLSNNFYLGANATYFDDDDGSFYGVALYPQYSISDSFALGMRAEYFGESDSGVGAIGEYDTNGDANVFDLTLTGNYSINNLMIIPEIRLDSASEYTFIDNNQDPSKNLSSFLIAAVYKF